MQPEPLSKSQLRWRAFLYIPLLWVSLGVAVGFAIAAAIGEHGSIIFLFAGAAMGVAGAAAHCLLFLVPAFRRTKEVRQVLLLWSSSVGLFMLYLLANWNVVSGVGAPTTPEFIAALAYVAAPLLAASAGVNRVVRRVAAA